jgi:hypothetical protein
MQGLARLRSWDSWFTAQSLLTARWIEQKIPTGDSVGCWHAGVLGYFSHRRVINLDGLVNEAAFFEQVLVNRDMAGYLTNQGIQWIADFACDDDPLPPMFTYHRFNQGQCQFTPALGRQPSPTTDQTTCSMVVWSLQCRGDKRKETSGQEMAQIDSAVEPSQSNN